MRKLRRARTSEYRAKIVSHSRRLRARSDLISAALVRALARRSLAPPPDTIQCLVCVCAAAAACAARLFVVDCTRRRTGRHKLAKRERPYINTIQGANLTPLFDKLPSCSRQILNYIRPIKSGPSTYFVPTCSWTLVKYN